MQADAGGKVGWTMTPKEREAFEAMREALRLAIRYLDHPDVQTIPFALHAEIPANRARAALALAEEAGK
jgi:hypothetical protein